MPLYTCSTFPVLSHHSPGHPSLFVFSHFSSCSLFPLLFLVLLRGSQAASSFIWYHLARLKASETNILLHWHRKKTRVDWSQMLSSVNLFWMLLFRLRHVWSSSWTSDYVGMSGGLCAVKILVLFQVRSDVLARSPANGWINTLRMENA